MDPNYPEEIFFPPEQQSPVGIELEEIFLDPSLLDACFGNESSNAQISFRDTDDGDEFVNSIWANDEELVINEERRHCFVNRSTQPKSLRRVYNANSGTDAEVVSNLVKINFPESK